MAGDLLTDGLSRPIGNSISNTYFIAGQLSTTQYTCSKPESDGSTTTSKFDFKRIQGNSGQCEVTETVKNPQKKQEFAKLSIDKCSWVPKCYSAGPSKFSLHLPIGNFPTDKFSTSKKSSEPNFL